MVPHPWPECGSNRTSGPDESRTRFLYLATNVEGVVAQLGERFVRNEEVESSILSDSTEGPVVQLGERQVCNLDVASSILAGSTVCPRSSKVEHALGKGEAPVQFRTGALKVP